MTSTLATKVYWNDTDWFSTPPEEEAIENQFTLMQEVSAGVSEALEQFYARFYPDESKETVHSVLDNGYTEEHDYFADVRILVEGRRNSTEPGNYEKSKARLSDFNPINAARLPWIAHQAAYQHYVINLEREDLYKIALKKKLQEPWRLSWHWRALLPYIAQLSPREYEYILQIDQIRNWELLLCYKHKKKDKNDHLQLIRAPIFGISHRIFRWDVYRLFYQSKLRKQIEEEVTRIHKEAKNISEVAHRGESVPFKLAYVLGRYTCKYRLNNISVHSDEKPYYQIELEPEISIRPETYSGKGNDSSSKPVDMVTLPTFYPNDDKRRKISVLLASDNYCRALSQLTEVMNDSLAKAVLLIAPSGSGKDNLALAASTCSDLGRDSEGTDLRYESTSLAGLTADEASKILFGNGNNLGTSSNLGVDGEGLLFKARNGTLFIDEIDKTKEEVRSMLLRLLESREVTLPGTSTVVSIDKKDVPLYVFAASESRESLLNRPPQDFWNRISHVIEMSHPFDIRDINTLKRTIESYVWMFWKRDVSGYLESRKLLYAHSDSTHCVSHTKANEYYDVLRPFFQKLHWFLVSDKLLAIISHLIAESLIARRDTKPSIRTLRSIVSRALFYFVDYLLYSKSEVSFIEKLKDNPESIKIEMNMNNMSPNEWFSFLDGCLDVVVKPENDTHQLTILKRGFIDDMGIIAQRAISAVY